jgi:hypothetical protein
MMQTAAPYGKLHLGTRRSILFAFVAMLWLGVFRTLRIVPATTPSYAVWGIWTGVALVPLSSILAMLAAGACDSWDMRTSRVVFVVGCCSYVVIVMLVASQGENISSAFVLMMSNGFILCVVGWCYTRNAYKLFVIVAVLVIYVFFGVITFTVARNL